MQPNPTLAAIGSKPTDRAVIFHADDIGMCQSTISAYADLLDFGLISAAAIMTPCSWFPAAAGLCRAAARLARLPAGISYFIVHPAQDSPELRAIAPDWRVRVADYNLFTSETWRRVVADSGVQVIGYEPLRARLRQL